MEKNIRNTNIQQKTHIRCILKLLHVNEGGGGGHLALAGVAQWIELRPANQRIATSIPSLGHIPGLWARSPVGGT